MSSDSSLTARRVKTLAIATVDAFVGTRVGCARLRRGPLFPSLRREPRRSRKEELRMKKLLLGAVALTSLVASAVPARADTFPVGRACGFVSNTDYTAE